MVLAYTREIKYLWGMLYVKIALNCPHANPEKQGQSYSHRSPLNPSSLLLHLLENTTCILPYLNSYFLEVLLIKSINLEMPLCHKSSPDLVQQGEVCRGGYGVLLIHWSQPGTSTKQGRELSPALHTRKTKAHQDSPFAHDHTPNQRPRHLQHTQTLIPGGSSNYCPNN